MQQNAGILIPIYGVVSVATVTFAPEIACASAGMLGGCITTLLTVEKRKPTRLVLFGELLSSAFLGFAVYAAMGVHDNRSLVFCVLAGGGGSAGYHKLVNWVQEKLGSGGDIL